MTTNQLYGIWGGSTPGGWCWFSVGDGRLSRAGTLEQAQAGREQFLREVQLRPNYPRTYEVYPFDHSKAPPSLGCQPSQDQWRVLDLVRANDRYQILRLPAHSELDVVISYGWVVFHVLPDGNDDATRSYALTAAGIKAWTDGYALYGGQSR